MGGSLGDALSQALENRVVQHLLVAFAGALIGIFASFTVNCVLVEISINAFFAFVRAHSTYFGILFLIIGSIIGYRAWTGDHPRPYLLASFSALVLLSAMFCFVLEDRWFTSLHYSYKVPVYCLLGVSVCFALLFSLIDVINFCSTLCWPPEHTKPIVNTQQQIYLVVGTAIAMGFSFGLVFGLFDVEDEQLSNIKMALMREESVCYPIGAFIGAIAAVVNMHLPNYTAHSSIYNPVNDDDLENEHY